MAFSNFKVPYSELEHLSFLALRIGKIDPVVFESLSFALGVRAVIGPLGPDRSRILVASSKKARFAMDTELKKYGFVPVEIAKGFKGIPDDVLEGLKKENEDAKTAFASIVEERVNYARTHEKILKRLLSTFSLGAQILRVRDSLESTQLVYRITGWLSDEDSQQTMKEIDNLTEGRVSIHLYDPHEVPTVKDGTEKVPVKLTQGKFIGSFHRMIFGYAAPLYGTLDPTPLVAVFFTLLFGSMFGDAGQGLVILLVGILFTLGAVKLFPSWHKFGPIFIAVGISSTIMGLLTGEFFCNHEILDPVDDVLAAILRIEDRHPGEAVLHLMPQGSGTAGVLSPALIKIAYFFVFTLAIGFVINSIGLIINIINQFSLGRPGKAVLGKTGIVGALFFWYVVAMAVRIAAFHVPFFWGDCVAIGITLFLVLVAEPLERLVEGHRPVFPEGVGVGIIHGIVEILEAVSSYFSSSMSFLRVGAFALAHAVLGFVIFTMSELVAEAAGPMGILIYVLGNALVLLLEGMIVTIQVVRLQYYEFFSKFFGEMGREFTPFVLKYKGASE
jgi:V/A-type H+-transporting ATPase subunit I